MNAVVIDDNELIRDSIKKMLNNIGYKVIGEASDGKEGLKVYKELNPDIVIMDIVMPKMDGFECLKRIKSYDENSKVLIISAIKHKAIMIKALEYGADNYLTKPLNEEDLKKKLDKIITS